MTRKIRFGLQTAPQNTTWQELRATWKLIDSLAYDTAWTFDHFFPILSDPSGPCFEGWIALTALAAETSRVQAGVLVSGNTYELGALVGSASEVRDRIAQFIDVGVTHFIPIANTPFNHESIRRFAEEVIPSFRSELVGQRSVADP